jgi:hypothetical protein
MSRQIFIVNNSNVSADDVAAMTAAVQSQLDGPFQDAWEDTAPLTIDTPPDRAVVLSIEQTSDVPGALGYHDKDANGIPYAKIFVDDSATAGVALSSVLSHEILELMVDRFVDAVVLLDNGDGTGTLYALEDCDPVEADFYTDANGVQLSNCVTPAWFDRKNTAGPFDLAGNLTAPFTLTPSGYVITRPVTFDGDWQQQFARKRSLFGRK